MTRILTLLWIAGLTFLAAVCVCVAIGGLLGDVRVMLRATERRLLLVVLAATISIPSAFHITSMKSDRARITAIILVHVAVSLSLVAVMVIVGVK